MTMSEHQWLQELPGHTRQWRVWTHALPVNTPIHAPGMDWQLGIVVMVRRSAAALSMPCAGMHPFAGHGNHF
jgi:hypothetical protein